MNESEDCILSTGFDLDDVPLRWDGSEDTKALRSITFVGDLSRFVIDDVNFSARTAHGTTERLLRIRMMLKHASFRTGYNVLFNVIFNPSAANPISISNDYKELYGNPLMEGNGVGFFVPEAEKNEALTNIKELIRICSRKRRNRS